MKFITMKRPLDHDVHDRSGKVVIPAGANRVRIAFRQSHLVRDTETNKIYPVNFDTPLMDGEVRLNVYQKSWNSPMIHA